MPNKPPPKPNSRAERLAAALKRNIARRKASPPAKTDKK
jgi:hypothetical protein